MVGGGAALGADRRHEHEMPDARARGGFGQPRGRLPVDEVEQRRRNAAARRCDAGEVNDRLGAGKQRLPVERCCQIRILHHLDAGGERDLRRTPHRGAHGRAARGECRDHGAADHAGCTGYQK